MNKIKRLTSVAACLGLLLSSYGTAFNTDIHSHAEMYGKEGEYFSNKYNKERDWFPDISWVSGFSDSEIGVSWEECPAWSKKYKDKYENQPREQIAFLKLSNGKWLSSGDLKYQHEDDQHWMGDDYLSYTFTDLKPATAYTIKLVTRIVENKDCRRAVQFKTMTCPEKVEKVTGHTSSNAARLTWNRVKCTGYKIQQYNKAEKKWKTVKLVSKNLNTARISGLDSGKKYKFRVVPYSRLNNILVYEWDYNEDDGKNDGYFHPGSYVYQGKPSKTVVLTTKK